MHAEELSRLRASVSAAEQAGVEVVLDVHNYGGYKKKRSGADKIGDPKLTVGDFVNLWKRLSMAFKDNPNVAAYDLMNEPGDFPSTLTQATDRWQSATMQALDAIRANGDGHLVMIPMYHKHGMGTGTGLPRSMELHPNGPWIEPMDRNIRYTAHWYPFYRSDEDGRMSYDEVNAFRESWGY